MTKESCHGETAQEMLCSTQPFPIRLFLWSLVQAPAPAPAPAPAMLPKPSYQGVRWPKRHDPGHQYLMTVVFGSPYV